MPANLLTAKNFFGHPDPPSPFAYQTGGMQSQSFLQPSPGLGSRSRYKSIVFYVSGLRAASDGYFAELSTTDPLNDSDGGWDISYPTGLLTVKLSLSEWHELMIGQVVPTTLSF